MPISQVNFVLQYNFWNHAYIDKRGRVTIFISTLEPYIPDVFSDIESAIEEMVIHELLHTIIGRLPDWMVDSWHRLVCQMNNTHIKESKNCECPIDCFWRDAHSR